MEFFRRQTKIDFLKLRKYTYGFSIVLMIWSLFALFNYGLSWGLDFTGGTQMRVVYNHTADLKKIRTQLAEAGFDDAVVQAYGNAKTILIRIGIRPESQQKEINKKMKEALPGGTVQSSEFIGPQVGSELATNGALALVIAMMGTMAYIAIRFEWRFAVSAAIALIHDPALILGVFAYAHIEFDLIALAAILTVIGYSLNDTIVVFDRVRENFRKLRKASTIDVVNISVNQTLSRTIMTSALTLVAVVALFYFGGEKVHGFATALLIGIVIGTYSSIYVAGALAVAFGLERTNLLITTKELIDDRP